MVEKQKMDGVKKNFEVKGDKLKAIVKKQRELMDKLETVYMKKSDVDKDKKIPEAIVKLLEHETKEMVLACHSECTEILEWINWKPWKKKRKEIQKEEIEEIRFEIIDLLHFVIELAIIWGMNEKDIVQYYLSKNKENFNRQERGY